MVHVNENNNTNLTLWESPECSPDTPLVPGSIGRESTRVWALCDWSKQNLAYDAEKPIAKLRTPHYTERVELKEPLEFPCKLEYERINVSIEGLKVKDRLEGNPRNPTATYTG